MIIVYDMIQMENYKYIKQIEDDIEEDKRLIEEHCALPDAIHKISITSDYLRGLKDNGSIYNSTYNDLKNKIRQLSDIARRKCKCEKK
jgi:hypothetical protein